jgi:uncharacterized protein
MSATCDTNVLLYASDEQSSRSEAARELLTRLAEGPEIVYLFWPVLIGYLRISTHPGVFASPLTSEDAMANVEALLSPPHVRTPGEQPGFWDAFRRTVRGDVVKGNLVSDAHLAALMRQHGVTTIWTADRDFRRFDSISARDPFA